MPPAPTPAPHTAAREGRSVPAHARIVAEVLAARHFRHLSPDLVTRVTAVEAPKAPRHADAVDRVKRRLHQVANAYVPALHAPRDAIDAIRAAAGDAGSLRVLAVSLMHGHASTAERLPTLDLVGPALRRVIGTGVDLPPRRVVDLACGLNPLLLPWLGLPRDCTYEAYDVDARLVGIVDAFLQAWGQSGSASVRDVVGDPVGGTADLVLLMKAVPCLDQVRAGSARTVLSGIHARRVIVTWPIQSLGGTAKGMRATYRRACDALVADLPYVVAEVAIPGELAFVLDRAPGAGPDA